jgi:hypothetical protein
MHQRHLGLLRTTCDRLLAPPVNRAGIPAKAVTCVQTPWLELPEDDSAPASYCVSRQHGAESGIDTLILACTHYPLLRCETVGAGPDLLTD